MKLKQLVTELLEKTDPRTWVSLFCFDKNSQKCDLLVDGRVFLYELRNLAISFKELSHREVLNCNFSENQIDIEVENG